MPKYKTKRQVVKPAQPAEPKYKMRSALQADVVDEGLDLSERIESICTREGVREAALVLDELLPSFVADAGIRQAAYLREPTEGDPQVWAVVVQVVAEIPDRWNAFYVLPDGTRISWANCIGTAMVPVFHHASTPGAADGSVAVTTVNPKAKGPTQALASVPQQKPTGWISDWLGQLEQMREEDSYADRLKAATAHWAGELWGARASGQDVAFPGQTDETLLSPEEKQWYEELFGMGVEYAQISHRHSEEMKEYCNRSIDTYISFLDKPVPYLVRQELDRLGERALRIAADLGYGKFPLELLDRVTEAASRIWSDMEDRDKYRRRAEAWDNATEEERNDYLRALHGELSGGEEEDDENHRPMALADLKPTKSVPAKKAAAKKATAKGKE